MEIISQGVYMIRPSNKCLFPYSNSLYIAGDHRILIDAGAGSRAYRDWPCGPPDQIMLSHYHYDHNNCLDLFPGVPILAGAEERWAYEDEGRFMAALGYQRWEELMGAPRQGLFADVFERPEDVPVGPGFRPIEPARYFEDGEVFDLGNTRVMAIHTPGHTPGHYAFFLPEQGILYSGDIDLSLWGPWYSAEVSDFDAMVASINRLRLLKPRMIISSHRQQIFTENLDTLLVNYLKVPLEKEQRLLEFLEHPRTMDEIANQDFVHVYPPRSQFQVFWNRMMIRKHLDRLIRNGSVTQSPTGCYEAHLQISGYPCRQADF